MSDVGHIAISAPFLGKTTYILFFHSLSVGRLLVNSYAIAVFVVQIKDLFLGGYPFHDGKIPENNRVYKLFLVSSAVLRPGFKIA